MNKTDVLINGDRQKGVFCAHQSGRSGMSRESDDK